MSASPTIDAQNVATNRCEHEDWCRVHVDWERCENLATTTIAYGDKTLRVCADDAAYYSCAHYVGCPHDVD
jgi:hypothetical protein